MVAGCGAHVDPSSRPTAPMAAAPTIASGPGPWAAADVVQPDVVTQAPSLEPGYQCSPCHPAAASQLFGIAPVPDGFIAVGVQQPPAEAIAAGVDRRPSLGARRRLGPRRWDRGHRGRLRRGADGRRRQRPGGQRRVGRGGRDLDAADPAASPAPRAPRDDRRRGSRRRLRRGRLSRRPGQRCGIGRRVAVAGWAASGGPMRPSRSFARRADAGRRGPRQHARRGGHERRSVYGPAAAWVSTDGTWQRAEVASPTA